MGSLSVQRTLMKMKKSEKMPSRFDEGGIAGNRAKEFDREHEDELGYDDRTRRYDQSFGKYYDEGEQGFAHGGMAKTRKDGAGKVDGIHSDPSECSHLAAGGVCRHVPPSKKSGENPKKFSNGGEAESFQSYLAKRHSARKMFKGGL